MSVAEFRDDEQDYLTWQATNRDGYVINIQRGHNPSDARMHHATCHTISGTPPAGRGFVGSYVKVCSTSIDELDT